jgi:hypothetical protein
MGLLAMGSERKVIFIGGTICRTYGVGETAGSEYFSGSLGAIFDSVRAFISKEAENRSSDRF